MLKLYTSFVIAFRIILIIWAVYLFQTVLKIDLQWLAVLPRTFSGLIGILTAPLIHVDLYHIVSNSIPLFILTFVLYFFYPNVSNNVYFKCYIYTNILVWLFSPRFAYHLGASGVVYGLASFLIFYGFFKKDFISILVSILIFITYGGIFYGILPSGTSSHISWETHLAGAIVGATTAFNFKNKID